MVEPFYKDLGKAIQRARGTGISQTKLGNLLVPKVTRACIANIESGKQRVLVHRLVQIADALKVPLATLLVSGIAKEAFPSESLARELKEQLNIPAERIKSLTSKIKRSIKK